MGDDGRELFGLGGPDPVSENGLDYTRKPIQYHNRIELHHFLHTNIVHVYIIQGSTYNNKVTIRLTGVPLEQKCNGLTQTNTDSDTHI